MSNKIRELVEQFTALAERRAEIDPDYFKLLAQERRLIVKQQRELIPQIRAEKWAELQAERERTQQASDEVYAAIQATVTLLEQANAELVSSRAAGETEQAVTAAAKVEELEARLRELKPRRGELVRQLAAYRPTETFKGSLAELQERAMDPLFLVSREWLEAMLVGDWRRLDGDDTVFVRFRLDTGMPSGKTDVFSEAALRKR